jgi:SAM-dependent methyltransferase
MKGAYEDRCCEVCGSNAATGLPHYTTSPWPVVECDSCSFVFLGVVPSYDDLSIDLAWEKTSAAEKKRRAKRKWNWLNQATRWRLHLGKVVDRAGLRRTSGRVGYVLEIGCGGDTRIAPGPIPYGIEISEALARKAAPVFAARGGRVLHGPAVDQIGAFDEGMFDAIIMRSYLEHEAQPRRVLKAAFSKLTDGGKIYVRVPNFGSINRRVMGANWCGFRFPDHCNYFTPRSLRRLAESIGYSYRRVNWFSPFDDNIIVELVRGKADRRWQR